MKRKKGTVSKGKFSDVEFYRTIEKGEERQRKIIIETESRVKNFINLVSMKTLSIENFNFPFGNLNKIRGAIKLQVKPYSASGGLDLFPVILERQEKSASGITFFVSSEELELSDYDGDDDDEKENQDISGKS